MIKRKKSDVSMQEGLIKIVQLERRILRVPGHLFLFNFAAEGRVKFTKPFSTRARAWSRPTARGILRGE